MNQLQLSERAYHHILKLARSIADLAASKHVQPAHLWRRRYNTIREGWKIVNILNK